MLRNFPKVTQRGRVKFSFTLRCKHYLQQFLWSLLWNWQVSGLVLKAFPHVLRYISCMITVRPVWSVLLKCPTFHMKEFFKVYVGFVVVAFLHMGQTLPIISVPATKSPQRYKWPPRSVLLKWLKKKKKNSTIHHCRGKESALKIMWKWKWSCSVVSDSLQHHGL